MALEAASIAEEKRDGVNSIEKNPLLSSKSSDCLAGKSLSLSFFSTLTCFRLDSSIFLLQLKILIIFCIKLRMEFLHLICFL